MELFAGGGLARAGLGPGWRCLLANDSDEEKAVTYRRNWGTSDLIVADVRTLRADQVVERPDLVWMSPPCQDLSSAGRRGGLDGGRSGALWSGLDYVKKLGGRGIAPRLIVAENVIGMASSRGGADLIAVAKVLEAAKYRVGTLTIDAKLFVPQSRPRLFILAVADDLAVPPGMISDGPVRPWHTEKSRAVADKVGRWTWWTLPPPPPRADNLADILDPVAADWHSHAKTIALLELMTPGASRDLDAARQAGPVTGTLTRRMRPDGDGTQQRAELRIDGVASCLRRSASQTLVVGDKTRIRTRQMTSLECARLMGVPDSYELPSKRVGALALLGDGVAVPVVRYLAEHLLEPLLTAPLAKAVKPMRPGIKGRTRATSLYLLPHELLRLRRLALDLDVSLHDLMLRGMDHVLAENGQRPLERYR